MIRKDKRLGRMSRPARSRRGSRDAHIKGIRVTRWANWTAWLIGGSSLLAIYLAARIAAPHLADPEHLSPLRGLVMPLLDESTRDIFEWIAAALCLGIALIFPKFKAKGLAHIENKVSSFANHRGQAILFCALFPVAIRLALLPILRVPEPLVADEFGYLLLANTFASGRLANPTHPLWKFFEGIYVLQHPTYTSIYPIASAILLAVPEIVGATPWVGYALPWR